jgi:hypothetical protein
MKTTWRPDLLPRPRLGILRDEAPAILWFEFGAPASDAAVVLVEIQLPHWWPLERHRAEARP